MPIKIGNSNKTHPKNFTRPPGDWLTGISLIVPVYPPNSSPNHIQASGKIKNPQIFNQPNGSAKKKARIR